MAHKLRLMKSPIVKGEKAEDPSDSSSVVNHDLVVAHRHMQDGYIQNRGDREEPGEHDDDGPEFQKHEEATASEVFYDLFFAANLTVFTDTHDVTDSSQLSAYAAYFIALWLTWALVGLYDVRYTTDSIFERIARAAHLGVMVGIAVVAPNFSPTSPSASTFRAMSIVLMASRVTIAAQYASMIWHVRKYKNTTTPLSVMVGLNSVAAIIYLGIAFAFKNTHTYLYATWYIVAILEVIVTVGLSLFYKVLSFKGTHLISRMSLLTFILIGEGVIIICVSVGRIVNQPDSWTSATIGNVVAGTANLYIVFQIYFDFMRHMHLPPYRQLAWALIHLPFHLVLALFIQGSSQFVIWWKLREIMAKVSHDIQASWFAIADIPDDAVSDYTGYISEVLVNVTNKVFKAYPPKYQDTWLSVNASLTQIQEIPNSWWNETNTSISESPPTSDDDPRLQLLFRPLQKLDLAIQNSLFATFKFTGYENVAKTATSDNYEAKANDNNWGKFYLVFTYSFVCAGLALVFMNILFIFSRTRAWSRFNYFRIGINFVVGLALCLVALVSLDHAEATGFTNTPWVLPTICLAFFFVLVLNHLPKKTPLFFRSRRKGGTSPVELENGRTKSWEVVGHLGDRRRKDHERFGTLGVPTEPGYEMERGGSRDRAGSAGTDYKDEDRKTGGDVVVVGER